jgi:hypothetical protein
LGFEVAARHQVDPEKEVQPGDEQCRALLSRILASSEFQRAARLRGFLSYVVERKLAGTPEEITETLIGHRVFGRPASYNSGDDSIVRTEARTLRQRLDRYFQGEGSREPVLIEIPRGRYVPVFVQRVESPAPEVVVPPKPEAIPAAAPGWRLSRRQWIGAGACAAAASALLLARTRPFARTADERGVLPAGRMPGAVQLESSDPRLTEAFQRAKQQALSCAFNGDPAGEWYATAPEGASKVFCMRDVAHQSIGAAVLGLNAHTANMLRQFAGSISRSRYWCGYWTINKDGFPDSANYVNDEDFGYALPANFDVMQACYRQWLWTGDAVYRNRLFSNFYDRTVTSYIDAWDAGHTGIMESTRGPRIQGSYHKANPRLPVGADLVAGQYAGYLTYAAFQGSIGPVGSLSQRLAREFRAKAAALRSRYNQEWWDADRNHFQSARLADRTFVPDFLADSQLHALWFGAPEDGAKTEAAIDALEASRPKEAQALSYFPEILFRYGRNDRAYRLLLEVADANFFGNLVGEVWFAAVGAVATGLMGIAPDATRSTVETLPRLPRPLGWAKLRRVPVGQNEITVEHRGTEETVLTNHGGPPLRWKAAFPPQNARSPRILIDGASTSIASEEQSNRQPVISATVEVKAGQSRTAKYSF